MELIGLTLWIIFSALISLLYYLRMEIKECDYNIALIKKSAQRNDDVYTFRTNLISIMFDVSKNEADYQWRYKIYDSVTYENMLNAKCPLEIEYFYPDTSFIKNA